ncbi:MAG: tetratricopeptide repeat protein [Bacteroidia bacterium]|nr:tetratricopeptide repeat protein [Bacteroidia bacterium]
MVKISGKVLGCLAGVLLFCNPVIIFAQDLKSAVKLTQSEQFEAAEKAFRDLLSKDSKNGDIFYYYGDNFIKSYFADTAAVSFKEMLDSAYSAYSRGIKSDAANPLNYVGLGSVALYRKDVQGAKKYFDRVQEIIPSKKYKDSPVTKEKAALSVAKIAEANIYSDFKDIRSDTALINQALRFDKNNPQVYIIAGDIFLEDNDGSKAIANYKKAQELDPKSTLAKTKVGNIYVRVRNLNAAIPFFEEAVTIDPNFAPVYRELGELYYKAGKYDKAESNYKKYLDLSNNFAAKTKYITLLYLIKKYDEAIRYINEVFKIDTSSVVLNRLAAYCSFETAKYADALKYSERFFRKVKPEKILSNDYLCQGKTLVKLTKDSIAIIQFNAAIKIDSNNADAYSEKAGVLVKMKKLNEVAPLYEKKISMNKASVMDYFNLGKAYYNMTDSVKTKDDTAKIIRADTLFGYFISRQPDVFNGYEWRARVNVKIDPESKLGLAKPWYEKEIVKIGADSMKYARDFVEALDFIASFNLFTTKDLVTAKRFYERILAIDPKNQKATIALASKELKNIKTK